MLCALERIRSMSEATAQRLASRAKPASVGASSPMSFGGLTLSTPQSMKPRLTALGLDHYSAERISAVVLRSMLQFKTHCETEYERRHIALRTRLTLVHDYKFSTSLQTAFMTIYTQGIENISSLILQNLLPRVVAQRRFSHSPPAVQLKRPFNQSAVPILERVFDRNPFPSRLEKFELASQCEMDYRQIDVWFQNRRRRCKREGKELKQPQSIGTWLEDIENSLVETLLSPETSDDGGNGEDALRHPNAFAHASLDESHHFHLDAPAHAFPSPYPPVCSYDPFPPAHKRAAFRLPWRRSAPESSPTSADRGPLDITDLISGMCKLSLGDDTPPHVYAPASRPVPKRHLAPYIGFTTSCPRAPHPSLILSPDTNCLEDSFPSHTRPRRTRVIRRHSHGRDLACRTHDGSDTATASPRAPRRALPRRVPNHPFARPFCQDTNGPQRIRDISSGSSNSATTSVSSSGEQSHSGSDSETPLSTPLALTSSLPAISDPEDLAGCFDMFSPHSPQLHGSEWTMPSLPSGKPPAVESPIIPLLTDSYLP